MTDYTELIKMIRYCANEDAICEAQDVCPFYDEKEEDSGYYFCVERAMTKAADAIEELVAICKKQEIDLVELTGEVASKPRWIPVMERLPYYGEKCLVVLKLAGHNDQLIHTSYCYVQKEGFWSDCGRDYHVTHWMPLPEPPEESEQ